MARLLDTNTCIYFLNKPSDRVISQFKAFSPGEIKLPSITVAELLYGAEKSKAREKNLKVVERFVSNFEILPFDASSCRIYAEIRASLERSGMTIGPMDLLIASIGLANNLVLVTSNTREFERVKGLKTENWV